MVFLHTGGNAALGGYDFAFGLGFLVAIENIFDELYNEPYNNRPEPGRRRRGSSRRPAR